MLKTSACTESNQYVTVCRIAQLVEHHYGSLKVLGSSAGVTAFFSPCDIWYHVNTLYLRFHLTQIALKYSTTWQRFLKSEGPEFENSYVCTFLS